MPTALDAFSYKTRAGARVLTWEPVGRKLKRPLLEGAAVEAVVTTRATGNLSLNIGDDPDVVRANRARAAAAIGLQADDLVFAEQVHGAAAARVGTADRGTTVADVDALVTTGARVGLVCLVADCVPIVLFDPKARVLATVHAGWRGTVARIVDTALYLMGDAGADPARIRAGLGPALPFARNQVGDDVAEAARDAFGAATDALLVPDDVAGKWRFDLWGANAQLLRDGGVPDDQIAIADIPTGPDGEFFSHRAEQPCGRFALMATMVP